MANDDKQHASAEASQAADTGEYRDISPIRRRLVKGTALALPAIMTVRTVNAQVLSETCPMKEASQGDGTTMGEIPVIPADNDIWARQSVVVYGSTGSPTVAAYYEDTVVQPMTTRYRVYSSGALVAGTPADLGPVLTGAAPNNSPQYALVFVGASGAVVALGPTGNSETSIVSDQCFASGITMQGARIEGTQLLPGARMPGAR